MVIAVNLDILIPASISAAGPIIIGTIMIFIRKDIRHGNEVVYRMAPQVEAIDTAVNGQPEGADHLVDKVTTIKAEQVRVREEKVVDDEKDLVARERKVNESNRET